MKCSMSYGANNYGNTENAAEYVVKLARKKGGKISISFAFDKPAEGRGIGSPGLVKSVSVTLPAKTARALSHALQLALSQTATPNVTFKIKEEKEGPPESTERTIKGS